MKPEQAKEQETIKVKPANKGLVVLCPETLEKLKPGGEDKPRNAYWLRRINDGTVIEIKTKEDKAS